MAYTLHIEPTGAPHRYRVWCSDDTVERSGPTVPQYFSGEDLKQTLRDRGIRLDEKNLETGATIGELSHDQVDGLL